ncbi:MAG: hypothetical protein F6J93_16805 [Oscillatoria sp. SIO1A7]|nr:hypothetical protein [Oscillatoria sp. SIO1A7]
MLPLVSLLVQIAALARSLLSGAHCLRSELPPSPAIAEVRALCDDYRRRLPDFEAN